MDSGVTLKPPLNGDPVFSHRKDSKQFGEGRVPRHFDVLILKKINPMD